MKNVIDSPEQRAKKCKKASRGRACIRVRVRVAVEKRTCSLDAPVLSRADPQDSAGAVPLESCGQVCKVGAFVADGYPMTRKTRQVSGVSKAEARCAHRSWKKEKERMIINMLRPLSLPCARCISSTQFFRSCLGDAISNLLATSSFDSLNVLLADQLKYAIKTS
ncbi:hypothetical protein NC653_020724 [Populus alba x Populus x berolinensis]|uniref:Uncharacterized protein n=1 Tax=Populus alba x Populus x berolinensis TaxID=444605 RepID=A0AAD6MLJ4_9ROSI|nr:hypothetical protein NC653_020724 [Populus alba x Populus x berolinensis]